MLIGGKPFASKFVKPGPVIGKTFQKFLTAPGAANVPSVGIAGNIPAATNPKTALDPALNHARLFQRPLIADTKLPGVSYSPMRGYLANVVPNVAANPAAFGGNRFQTALVEGRIKLRERASILAARAQTKFPVPAPGGQLGLAYLTGIKSKPRTARGFMGSFRVRETGGIRPDFAGLNNLPGVTKQGLTEDSPISTYQLPETDSTEKDAPQTVLPNQAADASAVYQGVEGGSANTVDAPQESSMGKNLVVFAMIGLVVFLVLKGRL